MPVGGGGGAFPQTGNNRRLADLAKQVADHDGGGNSAERRNRAIESIRDAVREFNDVPWKFCRVTTDITLAATADGSLAEFGLPTNFRSNLRAVFLDANGNERAPLRYVPVEEKLYAASNEQSPSSLPLIYTAFNEHERGKVRYFPRISSGTLQYPKVRHYYHKRILHPSGDDDRLQCPEEVENAIYMLAVAKYLAKQIGFNNPNTVRAKDEADSARVRVMRYHRDWEDIY